MMTRKEQIQHQIKAISDEMDSLEWELREYQEQINALYSELDNYDEEIP